MRPHAAMGRPGECGDGRRGMSVKDVGGPRHRAGGMRAAARLSAHGRSRELVLPRLR